MIFILCLLLMCNINNGEKCCSDRNLKNLDCQRLQLRLIPSCKNQKNVKIFLLGFNQLEILHNSSFQMYSKLKELRLYNNKMKILQENTFIGLINLEILYLNNNFLKQLPASLLSELPKLRKIYLHHNEFVKIPEISSRSLVNLYLGNNKIYSLYFPKSYLNCKKMRTIDLKHNLIEKLDKNHLYNLKKSQIESFILLSNSFRNVTTEIFYHIRKRIRKIDVSYNPHLSDYGFQKMIASFNHERHKKRWHLDIFASNIGLTKLSNFTLFTLTNVSTQKLDLSENFIEDLLTDFRETNDLLELSLNRNKIFKIAKYQFVNLRKLRKLDMSYNSISLIDIDGFQGLKSLKELLLSYNKISHLDLLTFNHLVLLKELTITGNNIMILTECFNYVANFHLHSNWSVVTKVIDINKLHIKSSLCFSNYTCSKIIKSGIHFNFEIDVYLNFCLTSENNRSITKIANNLSKLLFPKSENRHQYAVNSIIWIIVFIVIIFLVCLVSVFAIIMKVKGEKKKKIQSSENVYESIGNLDEVAI